MKIKIIICAFLVTLIGCGIAFFSSKSTIYNTSPNISAKVVGSEKLSTYRIPFNSIDELVSKSDLVILGEVISDGTTIKQNFNLPDPAKSKLNTLKSGSDKTSTITVTQATVKIDKVLYGDTYLEEIKFDQLGKAGNDDFQTKVKKNQKVILALKKNTNDSYASVDLEDGVFSVNENNKVFSFSKNIAFAKYDSLDLNVLIEDIKKSKKVK